MGLLDSKTAVVYGAGVIGGAVARAFAREGAEVFLAGRNLKSLQSVSDGIVKDGGVVDVATVDALDSGSVEEHLKKVVAARGKLDVSFNLISTGVAMGSRLTQLSADQFSKAAFSRTRSCFITSTAAARIMSKQGSGVILALTAPNSRQPQGETGGFSIDNAAIEALCKQLAVEAGPAGVRVVCLRTGATPENPVLPEVFSMLAEARGITTKEVEESEVGRTALKRFPLVAEVANAAVLMASDYASAITATPVNATCGELVD